MLDLLRETGPREKPSLYPVESFDTGQSAS
jgi:hypothetical protein